MKRTPGNLITFNCETNVVDHITTSFCTTRRIRDICTRNYQKSQKAHKYYRVSLTHSLTQRKRRVKKPAYNVQCQIKIKIKPATKDTEKNIEKKTK